jgi:hypothetical protein
MKSYCMSILSFLSDFGVEALIPTASRLINILNLDVRRVADAVEMLSNIYFLFHRKRGTTTVACQSYLYVYWSLQF